MNELINKIRDYIKTIYTYTEQNKTYNKLNSFNANYAKNIMNDISKLADIFDRNDNIYKSLKIVSSKLFYHDNYNNCNVDNSRLSYLKGIIDFIDSKKIKKPKIFISHSSIDIKYVDAFVEMLEKMGIKQNQLFCSSIQGYNVALNENIINHLSNELNNNDDVYVIMMLSKNYYNSPVCLNEMGVALIKVEYQAILLPNFGYSEVQGAIDPLKANLKLDDLPNRISRLNETKDKFVDKFELPELDNDIWERHRTKFVEAVDKLKRQSSIAEKKKLKSKN